MTYQIGHKKRKYQVGSILRYEMMQSCSDAGWYLVVLAQHKLVLLGTWCYRVSIGLFSLYYIELYHQR